MIIENDHIYNMDCLDGMRDIPSKSIDCVVTDCPYRICSGGVRLVPDGKECGGVLKKQHKVQQTSKLGERLLHNDGSVTPFAMQGKMFANNDIKFSEWLPDVYRVLKYGTHCYIMVNSRNLKDLQQAAEDVGFEFQNLLVWRKNSATPNKYYMQQLEFILMLRKGAARNVNDMGITNCLSVPNIIGKGAKNEHPTAKPIALMQVMIKQSTNEGDVVLDPFAGGGSTLIAANRLNRRYIGFEINKQYYDIAYNRLYKEPKEQTLF